jgi:hypothetical protein
MDANTQQNAAIVDEVAAARGHGGPNLVSAVSRFKVDAEAHAPRPCPRHTPPRVARGARRANKRLHREEEWKEFWGE